MEYALVILLLTLSGTQVARITVGPTFPTPEACRLYHEGRIVAWTREIASIATYACEPTGTQPAQPTALRFDVPDHDAA